eukprot:COSAG02_NODE_14968_length_1219_cov_1.158929_2_plen_93_part_01
MNPVIIYDAHNPERGRDCPVSDRINGQPLTPLLPIAVNSSTTFRSWRINRGDGDSDRDDNRNGDGDGDGDGRKKRGAQRHQATAGAAADGSSA